MKYIRIINGKYRVTVPSIIMENNNRKYIQKSFDDLELARQFRNEYLKNTFGDNYECILKTKTLPRNNGYISKTKAIYRSGTEVEKLVGRIKINGKLYTFSCSLDKYDIDTATNIIRQKLNNLQLEKIGQIIEYNMCDIK